MTGTVKRRARSTRNLWIFGIYFFFFDLYGIGLLRMRNSRREVRLGPGRIITTASRRRQPSSTASGHLRPTSPAF